ncbi:MAG: Lrp/AsnC family transcriptional regulator [Desulfobacterales bacterium]|jgi:DNA-binding Lrp family transcriptional regulator|nr:Lrp/AsnC family transcriptional regulator [Desulfobacterales bacterium]
MLTDLEKKVVAAIQQCMPISARPYRELADAAGITEEEMLATLRSLSARGVIRRFGATLRHQRTGYTANAMAAWRVEEERIDAVGRTMAGFRQVSHCYRRNPAPSWPYNLYTMIHAEDEAACRETARQMAQAAAVADYTLLFSREELKKTSMVYFATDDDS